MAWNCLTQIVIFALFAMSLDLLVGYAGLPSLGHAAYFGTSAYTTAILALTFDVDPTLASALGVAASVALAAVFNFLALRTAQSYYLMATLAFSQVLWSVAVSWSDVTGGDNGLSNVPRPWLAAGLGAPGFFVMALAMFCLCAVAMYVFVQSPVGWAVRGVRDNDRRMRVLGYNVWALKYLVSLVSALFAGIAGQIWLALDQFVSPFALSVTVSAQVLVIVMLGAAGTLFGAVIGSAAFVLMQFVLSSYINRWLFVMGAIYAFVALFAPRGALLFITERLRRRA